MTIQDPLARKRFAAPFAVIGGLILLFIAACASAFSMLIWEPAADPTAPAAFPVAPSQCERVQPHPTRRGETFGGSWDRKVRYSLVRARTHHRPPVMEATDTAGPHRSPLHVP